MNQNAPRPKPISEQLAEVEFVVPASMAIRYSVRDALADNWRITYCAALALCWPKLQHQLPRYQHDVLSYGARAHDLLLELGAKRADVLKAGGLAWKAMCGELMPTQAEVDEQEAFFGEKAESTSSSSGSRSDEVETPDGSSPSPTG